MKPVAKQIILFDGNTYDPDALLFILAANITDSTQKQAVNSLVVSLKNYNLWGKIIALYPFVGGNATAHKYNLKDPRDLDAAFRLTFNGSTTHGVNGVTFGINGYSNTYLQPSVSLSLNNTHISNYHTSPTGGGYISGCFETGKCLHQRSLLISIDNSCNGAFSSFTPTYISGLIIHTRNVSTGWNRFERGNKRAIVNTSGALSTLIYPIGCLNTTGAFGNYSNVNFRLASIGTGFSDSEANDFTNIVQAYQTELNRAIT